MSTHKSVERDERTVAVENASYKWAFNFVTFALLIDVVYRGAVRNEDAWDLMALAIVPSLACTMYQARQKILGPRVWKALLIGSVVAFVVSAVTAAILTITKAM